MSSRLNCTHRSSDQRYVRKVHRLAQPGFGGMTGATLCRLSGILVTIHQNDGTQLMCIRSPADHRYPVTDVDTNVTCIKCVRVVIGEPMRKKTVPKQFRSKHLRRAVTPLGLLNG